MGAAVHDPDDDQVDGGAVHGAAQGKIRGGGLQDGACTVGQFVNRVEDPVQVGDQGAESHDDKANRVPPDRDDVRVEVSVPGKNIIFGEDVKINKPTQEDLSPRRLTEEEEKEPPELKPAAGRGHVGVEQGAEVCNGAEGGAQHDRDSRGDSFL